MRRCRSGKSATASSNAARLARSLARAPGSVAQSASGSWPPLTGASSESAAWRNAATRARRMRSSLRSSSLDAGNVPRSWASVPPFFGATQRSPHAFRHGIESPQAVEHRPDDQPARVRFERRAAAGIEGIDGTDETDGAIAREIVAIRAARDAGDPARERANERIQIANRHIALGRRHRGRSADERGCDAASIARSSRSVRPPRSLRASVCTASPTTASP